MEQTDSVLKGGVRQLVELAISCGRKHQNEQTGFIHFCYTKEDEQGDATIPVYENLLFALSLMRSKNADTFQEGRSIIEKILPFQNFIEEAGKGCFPVYLHEYPLCKDRYMGIRLLPVFYSIFKYFNHVIGAHLKATLIESCRHLLAQCMRTHHERPVPYSQAFTLGLGAQALGPFIEKPSLINEGKKIIDALPSVKDQSLWYYPIGLSEVLIALQMSEQATLPPEWNEFWQFLSNTWHRPSCSYIGPGWCEYQKGEEPQATLYDLYMGLATERYSYRAFIDHPFQLQGSLIHTQPKILPPFEENSQGVVKGHRWFSSQKKSYGICLLKENLEHPPSNRKTYVPLKVIWGDRLQAHSLVCQGGNFTELSYHWHPDGYVEMDAVLGNIPKTDDKEESREVVFFTEALDTTEITVCGVPATTFRLGEEVQVSTANMKFKVIFSLVEGHGSFLGHIMRGNRPAQSALKGPQRLHAFDWQIFIRTVHRAAQCKFKVTIQIQEDEFR